MVTLPIPGAGPGGLSITGAQVGAALAALAVAGVNYLGVRLGGTIQVALTAVKVAVLLALRPATTKTRTQLPFRGGDPPW